MSAGPGQGTDTKGMEAKIVQSKEVEEEAIVEDPLCHLVSDTDSELKEDIKQVCVSDEGVNLSLLTWMCKVCLCMGW